MRMQKESKFDLNKGGFQPLVTQHKLEQFYEYFKNMQLNKNSTENLTTNVTPLDVESGQSPSNQRLRFDAAVSEIYPTSMDETDENVTPLAIIK